MKIHRREFSTLALGATAAGAGLGIFSPLGRALAAHTPSHAASPEEIPRQYMSVRYQDVKWDKIVPQLGEGSPRISMLRIDPITQATQLLIWAPRDFHVPRHWHSANETHTLVSGTMTFECDGKREELGQGSFNYIPRKMVHQAWTKPDEDALLFITVDAAWDINWVDGPPQPPKKG
jgi:quercetin dioxygenase-like cupin family protein